MGFVILMVELLFWKDWDLELLTSVDVILNINAKTKEELMDEEDEACVTFAVAPSCSFLFPVLSPFFPFLVQLVFNFCFLG